MKELLQLLHECPDTDDTDEKNIMCISDLITQRLEHAKEKISPLKTKSKNLCIISHVYLLLLLLEY